MPLYRAEEKQVTVLFADVADPMEDRLRLVGVVVVVRKPRPSWSPIRTVVVQALHRRH